MDDINTITTTWPHKWQHHHQPNKQQTQQHQQKLSQFEKAPVLLKNASNIDGIGGWLNSKKKKKKEKSKVFLLKLKIKEWR